MSDKIFQTILPGYKLVIVMSTGHVVDKYKTITLTHAHNELLKRIKYVNEYELYLLKQDSQIYYEILKKNKEALDKLIEHVESMLKKNLHKEFRRYYRVCYNILRQVRRSNNG